MIQTGVAARRFMEENTSMSDSEQSEPEKRPHEGGNLVRLERQPEVHSALQAIDARIAGATVDEMYSLVLIREELLRQNNEREDLIHARNMEKLQLILTTVVSVVAIVAGVILVFGEFTFAGFFVLGAGLSMIAPDLVATVARRVFGGSSGIVN
jgi:hypothetical protein